MCEWRVKDARVYCRKEGMFVVMRVSRVVRIRRMERVFSWWMAELVVVVPVDWASGSSVVRMVHLAVVALRRGVFCRLVLCSSSSSSSRRLVARLGGE